MIPGLDGWQVASALKADLATANIPIIMVTAQSDCQACLAALEAGAEEFLTKPVDGANCGQAAGRLLLPTSTTRMPVPVEDPPPILWKVSSSPD